MPLNPSLCGIRDKLLSKVSIILRRHVAGSLVDRLLRADSICFLLCVCMTIGSTFATLYWLFSPSSTTA